MYSNVAIKDIVDDCFFVIDLATDLVTEIHL